MSGVSSQAGLASFRRRYGGPILPPPSGVVPPGAPATGEPLPKLTVTPGRIYAHPIEFDEIAALDAGTVDDLVRDVQRKLAAEDARLRRLLPTAPDGYEWHGEISHETEHGVDDFTMHDTIRLRYRLVKIVTE